MKCISIIKTKNCKSCFSYIHSPQHSTAFPILITSLISIIQENNDDVDDNIDGDESLTESEKKREHEDSLLEEQSEPKRTKQSDTDQ